MQAKGAEEHTPIVTPVQVQGMQGDAYNPCTRYALAAMCYCFGCGMGTDRYRIERALPSRQRHARGAAQPPCCTRTPSGQVGTPALQDTSI